MRAFVAIALPEAASRLLAGVRAAVVDADPSWREEKWVAPENLHLTLRFLGDVPAEDAGRIASALSEGVGGSAPFAIEAAEVRAMPSPRRATMLWASFTDPQGEAARLAEAVARATAPWCAEEPGRKAFKPHATLVRTRRPRRVAAEALEAAAAALLAGRTAGDASMSVRHVILVSSTLTPRGPVYEELAQVPLGGD